ncbi:54S ribosomal protein L51, mitochondrial [Cytospora mali]|uniref:Large ribosomal subunit protein mL43 n=1 Tax=Cytospora mali TaxID=578113 RepID=A0A194VP95_CYTMA|nr:54S ribosomal protein L51, mitochondrial [Valsa mali]
MTIKPALEAVTKGRNGLGAFVLQCRKMDFHYCDWAGSSRGMNSFIQRMLPKFAAAHPEIEITVSPRPSKHPIVNAHYINGNTRTVCVRNMHANQIQGKAELLRDSTGEKNKRTKKPVKSFNESVRGIWSPYHGNGMTV